MLKTEVKPYGCLACISGGGMPQIENAIGIIKAIYAHDLCKFDEMWGTSAGALVSALNVSFNQDIGRIEELVKTVDVNLWFKVKRWQAIKSFFGFSNYLADNTGLKEFLLNNLTDEAAARVKCAVTEMKDGYVDKTIMCPGDARSVLASMSFQHVFPPVIWDGIQHTDGGVFNNCPLPKFTDFTKYERIYIILAAEAPILPRFRWWSFADRLSNLLDCTMNREFSQIHEMKFDELPNVVVFQPKAFVPSSGFLNWSNNFDQIKASYDYALDVLEQRGV